MDAYFENEKGKLYLGDCDKVLDTLEEKSVDMCITSPPYWGLRDYEDLNQLGREEDFKDYITKLTNTFDKVYKVLKPEGTLWVVIGDAYSTRRKGDGGKNSDVTHTGAYTNPVKLKLFLPEKCLMGIPFRFAIEMTDHHNWLLRNTIIWKKNNAIPQSSKDRFTVDFEYLFFFSKSKDYYFEQQREPHVKKPEKYKPCYNKADKEYLLRWQKNEESIHGNKWYNPLGRNKRSVWEVNVKPFKGKHFATFPEKLIETPILAGCPENGNVLDIYFGSGTTGIVAEKLNRNWIGIELNKDYCDLAIERINDKTLLPD